MGIPGLLKELPGGTMADSCFSFSKLIELQDTKDPIDIDSSTLVFLCALKYKDTYKAGNYIPAVPKFHRQIIVLDLVYKWKYTCIFDGCPPAEKAHEHRRHSEKEDSIRINSTCIAMHVIICKRCFVKYTVAPTEADMQVGRRNKSTIVVCRDSDEVAYGNKYIVMVDSYSKEAYRIIDTNQPNTE